MAHRILCVDDDDATLKLIGLTLRREGFEVMTTAEPENTLSAALVFRPDLVLCDVMMPNVDGFEVLRRLQGHPLTSSLPIVFLTAGRAADVKTRALRSGVVDYVTKPFTTQGLLLKVRRSLLAVARGSGAVSREIQTTPTEEFLERLQEELRSGVMLVRAGDVDGAVVLRAGHVLHATFGRLTGDRALEVIYQLRSGDLRFREADGARVALFDGRAEPELQAELAQLAPDGPIGSRRSEAGGGPRQALLFGERGVLRDSLEATLRREGFEVRVADAAQAALSEARRVAPDVVLVDLMSPHCAAVAFLEALRDVPSLAETPVLMLCVLDADALAAGLSRLPVVGAPPGASPHWDALRARLALLLQQQHTTQARAAETVRPAALRGDLRHFGVGDVAYFLERTSKSGWVMIVSQDSPGTAALYYAQGALVHAELDEQIAAEPESVLDSVSAWNGGTFEFYPD